MVLSSKDIEHAFDSAMLKADIRIREFKKEQQSAIHDFASGRDVFVSHPTGYGNRFAMLCCPPYLMNCARASELRS